MSFGVRVRFRARIGLGMELYLGLGCSCPSINTRKGCGRKSKGLYLRKEGNVLFNDALNTFYLRLYGITHMIKDYSDSERGNPLPPHGLWNEFINSVLITKRVKTYWDVRDHQNSIRLQDNDCYGYRQMELAVS